MIAIKETENKEKIWLSSPHMSGSEIRFINDAFDNNWIAPLGPNVTGFENDLENYLGFDKQVAALSSGTGAIHLGLKKLGVSNDDLVICQSLTFVATANPILYLGANPMFVDSERDTWNLCPIKLEEAIKSCISQGKKPKAIVAVHLYGMPYKVNEINKIAAEYNIPILEDSAEALGSKYLDQNCGTLGDISILSFNGNKIITTSGGGAIICNSKEDKQELIHWATQSRDQAPHYQHSELGFNYRMSNIVAGIGRGQMTVLDERIKQKRKIYNFYKLELSNSNLEFLNEPKFYFSNRWLTCVLTESYEHREAIRLALLEENIESRPIWKPMHQQPLFKNCQSFENGVADDLFKRGICLPSDTNMTSNDLERIVKIIKNA